MDGGAGMESFQKVLIGGTLKWASAEFEDFDWNREIFGTHQNHNQN